MIDNTNRVVKIKKNEEDYEKDIDITNDVKKIDVYFLEDVILSIVVGCVFRGKKSGDANDLKLLAIEDFSS